MADCVAGGEAFELIGPFVAVSRIFARKTAISRFRRELRELRPEFLYPQSLACYLGSPRKPWAFERELPTWASEKAKADGRPHLNSRENVGPFESRNRRFCGEKHHFWPSPVQRMILDDCVAEGEGFEPPGPFRAQRFSRPPVSTAHPPLRRFEFNWQAVLLPTVNTQVALKRSQE
jgi:hypothetical protein